jgi:tRNA threonylcarbamoyl adenosine modification protein YjeE
MRTASEAETFQAGRDLSAGLRAGDTVLLDGDLGTGKTVFARGVAAGLGVDPRSVHSPTFTLVNVYAGRLPVYHIDLFRIEKPEDLRELGLEDVLGTDGVALVEWPGRLGRYRPAGAIHVILRDGGGERREITVERPAP